MEQSEIIFKIKKDFGREIVDSSESFGEVTVVVSGKSFYKLAEYLRSEPDLEFDYLANITAVDYLNSDLPHTGRFAVVYHMYSINNGFRLRVRVPVDDPEMGVQSVVSIWKAAGFFEREAFDMFGIRFEGNPDLRRIYMPEEWEGYPLRKDYPLKGYSE